jgi:hypothetical protein
METGYEPAYGGAGSVLIYIDDLKVVHAASGVNNLSMGNNVRLYPNPVRDNAIIELNEPVQLPCVMSVRDISGRAIRQQVLHDRRTTINKTDLGSGMYFMHLTDNEGLHCVQKMIVE